MAPSRRRRLRARIALVAIAALLWSQVALGGQCLGFLAGNAPATVSAMEHGCADQAPAFDHSLCAAHCNQRDLTADSGRIPPVPPMLAAPAVPLVAVAHVVAGVPGGTPPPVQAHPPVSWHWPTAHPAALLLI